ncbi:hypothetical protein [Natronorubrum sp. FCH18a]|uniref:hypothetical protein n=1 Tax=Natronorubrum sp. FCH18a TaxID=3447018 RepID=UPI003F5192EE
MERRTFIATAGIGIGVGVAGCLDAGGTADEGDETTAIDEGDTESHGSTTIPATFEVASTATNSPVGGGELLVVDATIENVGDEEGTTDVDLVVGHTPAVEDSQMLTLGPGETADLTLEFQAGYPAGDTEEFPVCVDTGAHEACETVVVGEEGGNGDPDPGEDVTFESCERAIVSGTFEEGDIAYASTGFYTESGFGNTIIEDGITIGEDVAPFTGTITFEIADERAVSEGVDGVIVTVPEYGEYGTAITGLTTDPDDYVGAGITHSNPHAEECLAEFESEWEDETGQNGDPIPATFEVTSMATNSPVGGGELLVVDATIENVGDESGTTDVDLVVGHDPAIEDSRMLTLEASETADLTLEFRAGYPAGDSESFPVCVDTGAHESCETVTVE